MADKIHEDYWDAVRDYDRKVYGDERHSFDNVVNHPTDAELDARDEDWFGSSHDGGAGNAGLLSKPGDLADPRGCVITPCGRLMSRHVTVSIFDFRDALHDVKVMQKSCLSPYALRDAAEAAIKRIREVWEDDAVRPLLTHEGYGCGDWYDSIDEKRELLRDIDQTLSALWPDAYPSSLLVGQLCDRLYGTIDGMIVGGADGLVGSDDGRKARVIRLRRYPDGKMGL